MHLTSIALSWSIAAQRASLTASTLMISNTRKPSFPSWPPRNRNDEVATGPYSPHVARQRIGVAQWTGERACRHWPGRRVQHGVCPSTDGRGSSPGDELRGTVGGGARTTADLRPSCVVPSSQGPRRATRHVFHTCTFCRVGDRPVGECSRDMHCPVPACSGMGCRPDSRHVRYISRIRTRTRAALRRCFFWVLCRVRFVFWFSVC